MKININWKHTFLIIFDLLIAAYLVMAVTSWNKPARQGEVCTKVVIDIADGSVNGFLTTEEIKRLLEVAHQYPLSKPIVDINPREIEGALRNMPFVNTAQCAVTRDAHVCITVTQRTPIVRVKAQNGEDYYIDDNGGVMPNSEYTSDMMIVTGNVTKPFACQYLFLVASWFMRDELWSNQIEQINILDDATVELVPRVGDHVVSIGRLPSAATPEARKEAVEAYVSKQMSRLLIFYKEGLKHAGWNKYDYINLEYTNQIVCRKSEIKKEKPVVNTPTTTQQSTDEEQQPAQQEQEKQQEGEQQADKTEKKQTQKEQNNVQSERKNTQSERKTTQNAQKSTQKEAKKTQERAKNTSKTTQKKAERDSKTKKKQ